LPGTSVFRQTRIRQDRRNGAEQPPLFYADPATGRILPERRKQDDVFKRNNGDCRKTTAIRFYRSNGEGGLEPDRRRHDLCGQPFVLYKFATMYPDARARFPKLYEYSYTREEIHRLRFKVPDDPRVPEWAQWLRKTSLDELPNFMNVLRGDMTLVGPRPDIPEMTQYYTAEQRLKLRVKPGITGLAQIMGRGNLTFQQTLAYDLQYVRNRSLLLDLKILYATAVALFADQNGAH
jgi:lipopolysaccharide/colanic/teichoic acid biosynthesis glycosyltransferase